MGGLITNCPTVKIFAWVGKKVSKGIQPVRADPYTV